MVRTSMMSGTFPSVVRPSARRAAAMSLRAEFLAPPIETEPSRRLPPVTSSLSMDADSTGTVNWRSVVREV
jgi:hypothetical protein